MLKAGIIGLPNVGKSTLFNALVENAKAQAANFPFCTIEPNKGIVSVPDQRLQELDDLSSGILRFRPKSVSVNPFSFASFTAFSIYSFTDGKAEK